MEPFSFFPHSIVRSATFPAGGAMVQHRVIGLLGAFHQHNGLGCVTWSVLKT